MGTVSPYISRAQKRIDAMPKKVGRDYVMSINSAEHDRVFRRTQSAKMAAREWERPIEPTWAAWMAGFCIIAFIAVVTVLSLAG